MCKHTFDWTRCVIVIIQSLQHQWERLLWEKKTQKQHSQCDDMQRVFKKKNKIKLHKEIVLSFLPGSFLRLSNMF